MDLLSPLLAYIAGIVTVLNPCVLPILPIILATALQEGRFGPVAFALGLSVTFTVVFVLVSLFGGILNLDETSFVGVGGLLLYALGVVLVVPGGQALINGATGWLQVGANRLLDRLNLGGLGGQFVVGAILGIAWSPCIGPTLGAASSLSLSATNVGVVLIIALMFSTGVSTVVLALSYGSRQLISARRQALLASSVWIKPVTGVVLITVGMLLLTGAFKNIEIWILTNAPDWLQAIISVSYAA